MKKVTFDEIDINVLANTLRAAMAHWRAGIRECHLSGANRMVDSIKGQITDAEELLRPILDDDKEDDDQPEFDERREQEANYNADIADGLKIDRF